ncbi:MAG: hypothetical protein JWR69_4085, partial [Pedosphaera sp.]|nr:hypothetical protein [Pedosphaera sp.]
SEMMAGRTMANPVKKLARHRLR